MASLLTNDGIVCSVIIRMLTIDVDSFKNRWVYIQTVYNVYKKTFE